MIRRALLAIGFLASLLAPALAQAPPAVPALPDTERRTTYTITSSACTCAVGFQIYGDNADVDNWIEVWVNGVRYLSTDPNFGWALSSVTGPLNEIPRPITDAVLTFNGPQTATIQIVGAQRPRRLTQFPQGQGVAARSLNQAFTTLFAEQREVWDKINDVSGRGIFALPGETLRQLPAATARALTAPCFDGSGNLVTCPLSTLAGLSEIMIGSTPVLNGGTPPAVLTHIAGNFVSETLFPGGTSQFLRADNTFAVPPTTPPGGSTNQLQYNAGGGNFGGAGGTTWNTSTNTLTWASGTVTASAPVLDLSQTWNNAAVAFTGFRFNVTPTAQLNGTSLIAAIQSSGNTIVGVGLPATALNNANAFWAFGSDGDGAAVWSNNVYYTFYNGSQNSANIASTVAGLTGIVQTGQAYTFNSVANNSVSQDTWLIARAPGVVSLNNNTIANPAGFQIYNKTDSLASPANYERASFDWTTASNILTIGTQKAGTGTARDINLAPASGNIELFSQGAWGFNNNTTSNAPFFRNLNTGGIIAIQGDTIEFSGATQNGTIHFLQGQIGWNGTGSTNTPGALDTAFSRTAAGVVGLTQSATGAHATGLQAYNNTDNAFGPPSTNYERAVFDWTTSANTLTIGAQAGGTGTLRQVAAVGGLWNFNSGNGAAFTNGLYTTNGSGTFGFGLGWNSATVLGGTSGALIGFTSSATDGRGALDTAIARNAAGILEIHNGTAGTFRDLALRHITGKGATTANSCTGFSLAAGGSDLAGKITLTSATTCSVNFSTTLTNAPACTVTPGSAASTTEVTTTTGGFAVTFGTAQTAFSYQCIGT